MSHHFRDRVTAGSFSTSDEESRAEWTLSVIFFWASCHGLTYFHGIRRVMRGRSEFKWSTRTAMDRWSTAEKSFTCETCGAVSGIVGNFRSRAASASASAAAAAAASA